MGVANTKSTIVTNRDATPSKKTALNVAGARLREQVATVEVAAADDDTSVYRLFRVRSSDRISEVLIANDAITGGTSFDIGVHDTAENGGAVVDADEFASAVDLSSAGGYTDRTNEAVATDIAKVEMPLWERLGLTADPNKEYDITLTANTVGTAAGTISGKLRYVEGS